MPTRPPDRRLAPLVLLDAQSLLSNISDAEQSFIGDDPKELTFALAGPGSESREEQARLLNCLIDENIQRFFLSGVLTRTEPLGLEVSMCVGEAYEVIAPRSVMKVGIRETLAGPWPGVWRQWW